MTQSRPRVFLDSNVIFSALCGASGAPRRILVLAAEGVLEGQISTQVDLEVRRNVRARIPRGEALYSVLLEESRITIVPDPRPDTVRNLLVLVTYAPDAMILGAALEARVDYFVTGDQRHILPNDRLCSCMPFRLLSPAAFLAEFEPPLSPESL